jgi:transcriptional regulator with GAF, ATPase, and Fis domain
VRIVAATNRNLAYEVEAGRVGQDLSYRLGVFPVEVPPLRARKEDIAILATHFLQLFCTRLNRCDAKLTADDLGRLNRYDWPGNVRELQHVLERAVILSQGPCLRLDQALTQGATQSSYSVTPSRETQAEAQPSSVILYAELKRRERENIVAALEQACWKVYGPGGAAELLGLKPTTLASRLRVLGISRR